MRLKHEVFAFGTKAETLERLRNKVVVATVPHLTFFDVKTWKQTRETVLDRIASEFGDRELAVRSSTLAEDGAGQSLAGAFHSCLNVKGIDRIALSAAVDAVVASFKGNPRDQVLVQHMVTKPAVSGVITTHVINDGAPYYVINYDDESGKTDTITGGTGVNKTVLIHRSALPGMVQSERVAEWLAMTRELEGLCGAEVPLDIEFAQGHDRTLYLLQVRRIVVEKNWNRETSFEVTESKKYIESFLVERSRRRAGVLGTKTSLGEMPDWNPAEIIGTSPRNLAATLYRYLITDSVWREARGAMGYRNPANEALLTLIGGRPFIDVRNSFNSFLPADLDDVVGEKLVDAWIARLDGHPDLHDKVEFEVAQTVLDFTFEANLKARYGSVLSKTETDHFRDALRRLTRNCITVADEGSLQQALFRIEKLKGFQAAREKRVVGERTPMDRLACAAHLLSECIPWGSQPFAIVARHAFIAESQLRSAVMRGALSVERLGQFKQSINTITSHLSRDLAAVAKGALDKEVFLSRYGHLRPGTYDILSLRYDQRTDLFNGLTPVEWQSTTEPFELTAEENTRMGGLLEEIGLGDIPAELFLSYARQAIGGREYAKFIFTKNLSDALEEIADWGEGIGLTRDDLSYLPLSTVLDTVTVPVLAVPEKHFRHLVERGRKAAELCQSLFLSYLIRDVSDVYVIPLHRGAPNFVTKKRIEGATAFVNGRMSDTPELYGMIVCIENADPGFDWIFTRNIAGLITKFGGSNSHMAIRCAEFGLPAAIGCGEQTFERIITAREVELNCADKIIRPVYG